MFFQLLDGVVAIVKKKSQESGSKLDPLGLDSAASNPVRNLSANSKNQLEATVS